MLKKKRVTRFKKMVHQYYMENIERTKEINDSKGICFFFLKNIILLIETSNILIETQIPNVRKIYTCIKMVLLEKSAHA